MHHLGGDAFLGGNLGYLHVATHIISFILSYVPNWGVEGRGKIQGGG